MGNAAVDEILSASRCIAGSPGDWSDFPNMNPHGLFSSESEAASAVSKHGAQFDICVYRVFHRGFDEEGEFPLQLTPTRALDTPADFARLGFDVVTDNSTMDGQVLFGCSPLSCNGAAQEFSVNRYCLFDRLEQAISAARRFAVGGYEPGPYLVVEVSRRRRAD